MVKVGQTNSYPLVIAKNYLNTVATHKLVLRFVRAERGTENININFLPPFFRYIKEEETSVAMKSFMYFKITANQRTLSGATLYQLMDT